MCFPHRDGNKLPFVLTYEWLGGQPTEVDTDAARAQIGRRYLHCYGPSTRGQHLIRRESRHHRFDGTGRACHRRPLHHVCPISHTNLLLFNGPAGLGPDR